MNRNLLKLVILSVFSFLCSKGLCTKQSMEMEPIHKQSIVQVHCRKDAEVMKKYLQDLQLAELHFYWTSGHDHKLMRSEYAANLKVDIGGTQHADIFPRALGALLDNAPSHLTVFLTCDLMTKESNSKCLLDLQERYTSRFQILDVEHVKDNVVKALHDHREIIEILFQNATKGNPAITSDVYRLIGLIYGTTPFPENLVGKQFTYCDVDTFCHGITHNDHTQLILALFAPPSSMPDDQFYIGRKKKSGSGGNDLIKMRAYNLLKYKEFCNDVLNRLNIIYNSGEITILNYFIKLQEWIEKIEQGSERDFENYLCQFSNSSVQTSQIINTTGPGLLDKCKCCVPLEQKYPHICSMEWHGTHLLEGAGFNPLIGNGDRDLKTPVFELFKKYCNRVSDAFYARRFGKGHPFLLKLVAYLSQSENFPYKQPAFKNWAKSLYENKKQYSKLSIEDWLDKTFEKLTTNWDPKKPKKAVTLYGPFYLKLEYCLKQLGVTSSFVKKDIDFRKLNEQETGL